MMRLLHRMTLRTKATAAFVALIVSALAVVAVVNIIHTNELIRREYDASMARTAKAVADACQLPLAAGDRNELHRLAHRMLNDPAMLFVAVYAQDGRPMVTEVRDQAAWEDYQATDGGSNSYILGIGGVRIFDSENGLEPVDGELISPGISLGQLHDSATPTRLHKGSDPQSQGRLIGRIVLAHSIQGMVDAQRQHTLTTLTVMGVASLMGLAVMYVIVGVWTRRLSALIQASDRISRGQLDLVVPAMGSDEIGRLAGAFEHMRNSIAQRDHELRDFNDTLLQKVELRTRDLAAAKVAAETGAASLVDSEERFRQMAENINQVFWVTAADGRKVLYVSPAYERVWGRRSEDLYDNPSQWIEAIHADDRKIVESAFFTDSTRIGIELEYRVVRPDGSVCWVRDRGFPVRDGQGRIVRVVGAAEDITDRKRLESERADLTKQLISSSRLAGMAEVATGVLHNVGNVLNSVNVSASTAVDMLRRSRVGGVSKAAAMLKEHAGCLDHFLTVDERGRQLLPYLADLGEILGQEQAQALEELASLTKNIDHIKQIVSMQQAFAKAAGTIENVSLEEVVEDAMKINLAGLDRHLVRVERRFADIPTVPTDKHRVLQILINLISNAKYALSESGLEDRGLVLETGQRDGCVFVRVIDNGIGIPKENLTRVFAHGFTTKRNGHGFGLHSGSLAAKEMGGTLIAHSDGPGCGAVLTLELPLKQTNRSAGRPRNTSDDKTIIEATECG